MLFTTLAFFKIVRKVNAEEDIPVTPTALMASFVRRKASLLPCCNIYFNWLTWSGWVLHMVAEILTVKAKDRNSLELSLLLSPLFCQVQCLTRLIKLCKVPRLNDIKLATKAETKNNLQESHTFSIYYLIFLLATCGGESHTTLIPPACTPPAHFPKVPAAAQVYIDPNHKCHCHRRNITLQNEHSQQNHLLR